VVDSPLKNKLKKRGDLHRFPLSNLNQSLNIPRTGAAGSMEPVPSALRPKALHMSYDFDDKEVQVQVPVR
jgi:hypothetical protein